MQLLEGDNKRQQTAKVSGCNSSQTLHKACLLLVLLAQSGLGCWKRVEGKSSSLGASAAVLSYQSRRGFKAAALGSQNQRKHRKPFTAASACAAQQPSSSWMNGGHSFPDTNCQYKWQKLTNHVVRKACKRREVAFGTVVFGQPCRRLGSVRSTRPGTQNPLLFISQNLQDLGTLSPSHPSRQPLICLVVVFFTF